MTTDQLITELRVLLAEVDWQKQSIENRNIDFYPNEYEHGFNEGIEYGTDVIDSIRADLSRLIGVVEDEQRRANFGVNPSPGQLPLWTMGKD